MAMVRDVTFSIEKCKSDTFPNSSMLYLFMVSVILLSLQVLFSNIVVDWNHWDHFTDTSGHAI